MNGCGSTLMRQNLQKNRRVRRPAQLHPDGGTREKFDVNILGINAYHGNASAALVCDGQLVAAVEEERFNRVKYAAGFPAEAIRYCLREAGITLADMNHVAVPRNPWARLSADGLGDFASTMWASGQGNRMRVQGAVSFPHSLGMYYTAITQYL